MEPLPLTHLRTSNPYSYYTLQYPDLSQTPYGDPSPRRESLRTCQLPLRTVTRPHGNPLPLPANRYGYQPPSRTTIRPLSTATYYTVWQTSASRLMKVKRSGARESTLRL